MNRPAGAMLYEPHMRTSPAYVDLAISDGVGGVFLLRQPIDRPLQLLSKPLERIYIQITVAGFIVIVGIALFAAALRRRAQSLSGTRPTKALSRRERDQDRVRMAWIIALSAVIFVIDLQVPLGPAIGIAYIVVVVMAQFANNPFHMWLTVAIGTVLTVARVMLGEHIPDMWPALANRTLSVFALLDRRAHGPVAEAHAIASRVVRKPRRSKRRPPTSRYNVRSSAPRRRKRSCAPDKNCSTPWQAWPASGDGTTTLAR